MTNDEEDTLDTTLIVFFTAENRMHRIVNSLTFPCLFHNLQIKKTSLDVVHKVLVLVEKTEGKKTLGRPSRRREDNIKVDLQEVGWGMDWIDLAEDRDK